MVVSRSRPLAAVAGDNTIDVKKERRREPRREVRRGRQKPERCVGGLKRRNLNDALAEKGERCVGGPQHGSGRRRSSPWADGSRPPRGRPATCPSPPPRSSPCCP